MKKLVTSFFIITLIGVSVVTTGAAFARLVSAKSEKLPEISENNTKLAVESNSKNEVESELDDNSFTSKKVLASQNSNQNTQVKSNTNQPPSSAPVPQGNAFTAETLAKHNLPNDCYIAHQGTVYNVSSVPEWFGCKHHGSTGGIDVTPFFPHPISYLANVPKVGQYNSASTSNTSLQTDNSATKVSKKEEGENKIEDDDDEDAGEEFEFEDD